jgi:transcriptional regulator with XRE-family HTH domain
MVHHSTPTQPQTADQPLGDYLRQSRQALGLTLREVEARTNKSVTNGYLSQIEKNSIKRPSPNVLFNLANVYGLEYSDLLKRAGHHVPSATREDAARPGDDSLAGIPLRAIQELTEEERKELTQYIAFLRQRRHARGDRHT